MNSTPLATTPQGILQPPPAERLYMTGGVVRIEDLEWPVFDPEQPTTMAAYVGEIGIRMAGVPRESIAQDSALKLYRDDFRQAEPANLSQGLYFPEMRKPKKSVVTIRGGYCDIDPDEAPGIVPVTTGVAVPEDIYEELVRSAPHFANQVDNRTQRAHSGERIVEAKADLGGESAVYALAAKHQLLEEREQNLLQVNSILRGVHMSVHRQSVHRILHLEEYRLAALSAIQEMARVACKVLGYGTTRTQTTLNAVASNIHRSSDRARWLRAYTTMAINYNEAVQGKVNQSIYACIEQIGEHREQLISSIDREYGDG